MKSLWGRPTGSGKASAVLLLCLSAVIALAGCGGEQTSPAADTPGPVGPTAVSAPSATVSAAAEPEPTATVAPADTPVPIPTQPQTPEAAATPSATPPPTAPPTATPPPTATATPEPTLTQLTQDPTPTHLSRLPTPFVNHAPYIIEQDAQEIFMIFQDDCIYLKPLIRTDEINGARTYLEHRIAYKSEIIIWMRQDSDLLLTELEADQIITWAWALCDITDSNDYPPTDPNFVKPQYSENDLRIRIPDAFFIGLSAMTESEAIDVISIRNNLCLAQKEPAYIAYQNGTRTISESRIFAREIYLRRFRADSNVILTELQATQIIDWIYSSCDISAQEATNYTPNAIRILSLEDRNSFPHPRHPLFVDNMEEQIERAALACAVFDKLPNLSVDDAKEAIADRIYFSARQAGFEPQYHLTKDEAASYADWLATACGAQ